MLKEKGFWATKLKEKEMGGPLDVVATKDNIFYSFELKHLKDKKSFTLERVEPNQIRAYRRLCEVGSNKNTFFVFKTNFGIFLIHSEDLINCDAKSINVTEGIPFEEWSNCVKEAKMI